MMDYSEFTTENLQISKAMHEEQIPELTKEIDRLLQTLAIRRDELLAINYELEQRKTAGS